MIGLKLKLELKPFHFSVKTVFFSSVVEWQKLKVCITSNGNSYETGVSVVFPNENGLILHINDVYFENLKIIAVKISMLKMYVSFLRIKIKYFRMETRVIDSLFVSTCFQYEKGTEKLWSLRQVYCEKEIEAFTIPSQKLYILNFIDF